jgi:ribonuclease P protein component
VNRGRNGETPRSSGFRLPRAARIRRGSEIRTLFRRGRRYRIGALEVFVAPAPGDLPRFGLVVPKHGRRIADRNRVRRRLRELGRTEVLPRLVKADHPVDVLVRARPGAYSATFSDLQAELVRLTERLCSENSLSD